MQKDWIPGKTEAGVEEIATRARRLPPRLRTLLILVDGRRGGRELAGLVEDIAVGERSHSATGSGAFRRNGAARW